MTRKATAQWQGSGKEGSGTLSLESGILKDAKYTYRMRFEDEPGTNPEELVAAAHAGCFSMKLSFILGAAGFTPESIQTTSAVTLRDGAIREIHLTTEAKVPGMDAEAFQAAAEDAKVNCPISQSLNAAMTLTATLVD